MLKLLFLQAALMWTMKYSDLNTDVDWKKLFQDNFLGLIKFHKIPANILMKDVDPLKVVPNDIIVTALAYQVRFFYKYVYQFCCIFFYLNSHFFHLNSFFSNVVQRDTFACDKKKKKKRSFNEPKDR